jgi:hypothetical protein
VHYARSAAKSGKIRYNPDTFGITVLTPISSIHELSTTSYNGSYISKAMKPIYEDAAKIKNRGAPLKRAEFTEQKVTKRNGVWLSVHDSIDTALDKLFSKCEDAVTAKIIELFEGLHRDFLLLCDGTEAKEERTRFRKPF